MKTSRLNYNIIRLNAIDKNDYYIKCKQFRWGGDVANLGTNAPHALSMALLTSISRSIVQHHALHLLGLLPLEPVHLPQHVQAAHGVSLPARIRGCVVSLKGHFGQIRPDHHAPQGQRN